MTISTKKHKLIIFDMDGTLSDRDTGELLEGVTEWFAKNGAKYKFALCTNQGGVGLRYWMETNGFGKPENYPTEDDVYTRIVSVIEKLFSSTIPMPMYVCFAYKSQKGEWSPVPAGKESWNEWKPSFRKPSDGMLVKAMIDADILEIDTLMVGDSPEDEQAALNATVDFKWAWDFFGREKPTEEG